MNYKHSYHAGNFADVFKHWVLMLSIQQMQQKEAPFVYIDTHAGSGIYDLSSEFSKKTNEAELGIKALWSSKIDLTASLQDYLKLIKNLPHNAKKLCCYPGSPMLVQNLLRPNDQILLNELQPSEAASLKKRFHNDMRARVYSQDAYQWLLSVIPPKLKRGLVLIDPPYEQSTEYEQLLKLLTHALKRWQNGSYMIWYPLTKNHKFSQFYQAVKKLVPNDTLNVQLSIYEADSPLGLNGSGMLFVNPPWQLAEQIQTGIQPLWEVLSPSKKGRWNVEF
ncbi:MAG TPA: 23S rRNA (adenine(2030)-N(6))-methyltransferase RlmJ [Coxiellaceae bacterium]|nr:23S rRNA (adenine(2030)-N(6))-methyltransferase RlmJ [Coxiellaceae bacterium]